MGWFGLNVPAASPKRSQLLRLLSFEDKNNDGVIGKKDNEGYETKADINQDGEITEAEAKYYLLSQSGFDRVIKNEYALNENERSIVRRELIEQLDERLSYFNEDAAVERLSYETRKINEIIIGMEEAGMLAELWEVARLIEDKSSEEKELVLLVGLEGFLFFISEMFERNGFFEEAIETLEMGRFNESNRRLLSFAVKMAGRGLRKEALRALRTIPEGEDKDIALKNISFYMALGGFIAEAHWTAEMISQNFYKDVALKDIYKWAKIWNERVSTR